MIHFYINSEDIYIFAKLKNTNSFDLDGTPVLLYYNTQESDTIMVSLNIDTFIFLTDNDHLKPVQLLNN